MSFFLDFTHLKVMPETTEVIPAFVQEDPAFAAAFTGVKGKSKEMENVEITAIAFRFIERV
jgi:hypothetical protein